MAAEEYRQIDSRSVSLGNQHQHRIVPPPSPLAVVTGASSGIGRELARMLAKDGHDLLLVARRQAVLDEFAAEMRAEFNVEIFVHPCDLAVSEGPASVLRFVEQTGRGVSTLVNAAGFGDHGSFHASDVGQLRAMVQLNVWALTELTRVMLPALLDQPKGRVLNIASAAAFQPGPLAAVYHASKAYVLSLGEAIAWELRGTGVTVTTLCPGPTDSEFHDVSALHLSRMQRWFMRSPEQVARSGYRAMRRGRIVALPGWPPRLIRLASRWMPRPLVQMVTMKQMKRALDPPEASGREA